MTQPAVTQRLHALELELGTELLMRNAREVRLTKTDELLLPYATLLVQISEEALRDLKSNIKRGGGVLRVATATHIEVAVTSAIISELRRRHPSIGVETSFAYERVSVEQILERPRSDPLSRRSQSVVQDCREVIDRASHVGRTQSRGV